MAGIPPIERLPEDERLKNSPKEWADQRENVALAVQRQLELLKQTVEQRVA